MFLALNPERRRGEEEGEECGGEGGGGEWGWPEEE
jgi:hypothetical protein